MAGSLDEGRTRLVDMRDVALLVTIDKQGVADVHGLSVPREQAVIWLRAMADTLAEKAPPGGYGLLPAERIALRVAVAQVERGEPVTPNVAAVCVTALARIAG